MTYEPGEGPIDDAKEARKRAQAERAKPEHRYQRGPNGEPDPRDKRIGEADLDSVED